MRSALAACTIRKNMLADSAFWGHREKYKLFKWNVGILALDLSNWIFI